MGSIPASQTTVMVSLASEMVTGSEVLTDIVAMLTGMPRFHIGQWLGFSCPGASSGGCSCNGYS
jgi:hypothetical protein